MDIQQAKNLENFAEGFVKKVNKSLLKSDKSSHLSQSEAKENNYRRTETCESVQTFDDVASKVEEYLPNTRNALKISLATATSGIRKNRVMLWMLLVGSPSSGKTDLLKLIRPNPDVFSLDGLTLNAFISGERPTEKEKVHDLLPQLDGKCLAIKDLTVIFNLDERMTKKIIGDMVGAYDKTLSKFSSRRGQITYDSEFSFLGCITPATLNRHTTYLNMIGPRFLHYIIPDLSKDDEEKSFKAIFSNKNRLKQEKETGQSVSEYLAQINQYNIEDQLPIKKEYQIYFKVASRFMAKARGILIIQASQFKDESGNEITYYEPLELQIEQPWRAVQQLITLSKYLALVEGRNEVNEEDLLLIREVVLSSMPANRAKALEFIRNTPNYEITAKELSEGTSFKKSFKTAKRLLDELYFLGLLDKTIGQGQMGTTYSITEEFKSFLTVHPREFVSTYSDLNVETDNEGHPPASSVSSVVSGTETTKTEENTGEGASGTPSLPSPDEAELDFEIIDREEI